ncbi:hypothetical protein O1L44_12775 [Streptomyces noursei]|nr:hypothetical protein [Streptomyces noursei]
MKRHPFEPGRLITGAATLAVGTGYGLDALGLWHAPAPGCSWPSPPACWSPGSPPPSGPPSAATTSGTPRPAAVMTRGLRPAHEARPAGPPRHP